MFIKGKGHIIIGKTETETKTKITGIQIRIEGKGKGNGNGNVPASNPGRFPLSLPKKKPAPNGLPAPASDNKKPIGAVISSVPFGQRKK